MQLEENALAVSMKHWLEKALKIFTDTASTSRAWKRLRILLPHTKDPATGLYVPLLWPHGTASHEAGSRMRDIDKLEKLTHTVMGSRCPSSERTNMNVNIDSPPELTTKGERSEEAASTAAALGHTFKFMVSKHCDAVLWIEKCDDKDPAAVLAHVAKVEALGYEFLTAFLQVASQKDVTVYIHMSAVHLGQMIRRHGSPEKWCRMLEALHKWVHFFGRHRSNKRGQWVATTMRQRA
eukprot:jgi/Tetstr1/422369/TSEL_013209.t1